MVVNPSGFCTDWAGRSANESEHPIEDYQETVGKVRLAVRASSGKQPGDPVRTVQAIVDAVASAKPPHHLLLGNDAFEDAMAKFDELRQKLMRARQYRAAPTFQSRSHNAHDARGAGRTVWPASGE